MGVGPLARFWNLFAISATPREMWTHASGVMPIAFFSHEAGKAQRHRHMISPFYPTVLVFSEP